MSAHLSCWVTSAGRDDDAVRRGRAVIVGDVGVELLARLALPHEGAVRDDRTSRDLGEGGLAPEAEERDSVLQSSMPLNVVREPVIVIDLVDGAALTTTVAASDVTGAGAPVGGV